MEILVASSLLVLLVAGVVALNVWSRRDPGADPSIPDSVTGISEDDWHHAIR